MIEHAVMSQSPLACLFDRYEEREEREGKKRRGEKRREEGESKEGTY